MPGGLKKENEINATKIYSPFGKFAEPTKPAVMQLSDMIPLIASGCHAGTA